MTPQTHPPGARVYSSTGGRSHIIGNSSELQPHTDGARRYGITVCGRVADDHWYPDHHRSLPLCVRCDRATIR